LVHAVQSELDPNERGRLIIQAAKVLTEQVGTVSLFFNPSVLVFPAALQGVEVRAPEAGVTWNVHLWTLR
jgi:ABC-type transport system substrate-binding protein